MGHPLIIFVGHLLVINQVYDSPNQAQATGKKVKDTHPDLTQYKPLDTGYHYEPENGADQYSVRSFSFGGINRYERPLLFFGEPIGQVLQKNHLVWLQIWQHGYKLLVHVVVAFGVKNDLFAIE